MIFNVYEYGSNNLLLNVKCYDKKMYKLMIKQFKKIKQVWVEEM